MHVPGLKDVVRTAYENNAFSTNGKKLPAIDFAAPLVVEITALDSLSLVSIVTMEDDEVKDHGKAFTRTLYLQLHPTCVYHDVVVELLCQNPVLNAYFTDVKKIRISITGFTPIGLKPVLRAERKIPMDCRGVSWRKLTIEAADFATEVA
jgi:hypothetical protein